MKTNDSFSKEQKKLLLNVARESILSKLEKNKESSYSIATKESGFQKVVGCFVTLNKRTSLRGCIGNIIGQTSLIKGVHSLAKESAFADPRFAPVTLDEMKEIIIEISVLTKLSKVVGYQDIQIGRDGILLTQGFSRAVFLPQVATEQGWDLATTLTHLSLKAGLSEDSWKQDNCEFEVFQAEHFSEDEIDGK